LECNHFKANASQCQFNSAGAAANVRGRPAADRQTISGI
jgi:hypothetical protein